MSSSNIYSFTISHSPDSPSASCAEASSHRGSDNITVIEDQEDRVRSVVSATLDNFNVGKEASRGASPSPMVVVRNGTRKKSPPPAHPTSSRILHPHETENGDINDISRITRPPLVNILQDKMRRCSSSLLVLFTAAYKSGCAVASGKTTLQHTSGYADMQGAHSCPIADTQLELNPVELFEAMQDLVSKTIEVQHQNIAQLKEAQTEPSDTYSAIFNRVIFTVDLKPIISLLNHEHATVQEIESEIDQINETLTVLAEKKDRSGDEIRSLLEELEANYLKVARLISGLPQSALKGKKHPLEHTAFHHLMNGGDALPAIFNQFDNTIERRYPDLLKRLAEQCSPRDSDTTPLIAFQEYVQDFTLFLDKSDASFKAEIARIEELLGMEKTLNCFEIELIGAARSKKPNPEDIQRAFNNWFKLALKYNAMATTEKKSDRPQLSEVTSAITNRRNLHFKTIFPKIMGMHNTMLTMTPDSTPVDSIEKMWAQLQVDQSTDPRTKDQRLNELFPFQDENVQRTRECSKSLMAFIGELDKKNKKDELNPNRLQEKFAAAGDREKSRSKSVEFFISLITLLNPKEKKRNVAVNNFLQKVTTSLLKMTGTDTPQTIIHYLRDHQNFVGLTFDFKADYPNITWEQTQVQQTVREWAELARPVSDSPDSKDVPEIIKELWDRSETEEPRKRLKLSQPHSLTHDEIDGLCIRLREAIIAEETKGKPDKKNIQVLNFLLSRMEAANYIDALCTYYTDNKNSIIPMSDIQFFRKKALSLNFFGVTRMNDSLLKEVVEKFIPPQSKSRPKSSNDMSNFFKRMITLISSDENTRTSLRKILGTDGSVRAAFDGLIQTMKQTSTSDPHNGAEIQPWIERLKLLTEVAIPTYRETLENEFLTKDRPASEVAQFPMTPSRLLLSELERTCPSIGGGMEPLESLETMDPDLLMRWIFPNLSSRSIPVLESPFPAPQIGDATLLRLNRVGIEAHYDQRLPFKATIVKGRGKVYQCSIEILETFDGIEKKQLAEIALKEIVHPFLHKHNPFTDGDSSESQSATLHGQLIMQKYGIIASTPPAASADCAEGSAPRVREKPREGKAES